MILYERAEQIAGMSGLVLLLNDGVEQGQIVVIPEDQDDGRIAGVYINGADKPANLPLI